MRLLRLLHVSARSTAFLGRANPLRVLLERAGRQPLPLVPAENVAQAAENTAFAFALAAADAAGGDDAVG